MRTLVERMLKPSGRRIDLSSPFVDATLPDGSRLHVAIPDITRSHWLINTRQRKCRSPSVAPESMKTVGNEGNTRNKSRWI